MFVLDILKQSSTGLTRAQLDKKCRSCGINPWLGELKKLIDNGLARKDEHPKPVRFKPTNMVW